MAKLPDRREEKTGGSVVHKVPFPKDLTPKTLADLQDMAPILIEQPYAIRYLHSYGQDSPFFAGLTNRVLLGARDPETGYTYATPRGHDMYSGRQNRMDANPGYRQGPLVHGLSFRRRGIPARNPVRAHHGGV